jgi:hypothetical protein
MPEVRTSLAKIQLYKKLRNEKEAESTGKKMANTSRLPKAFEREAMLEDELTPIKWRNFTHVGTH